LMLLLLAAFAVLASFIAINFVEERKKRKADALADLLKQTRLIATQSRYFAAQAHSILNGLMLSQEMQPDTSAESCSQYVKARMSIEPAFIQGGRVLPDGDVDCAAVGSQRRVNFADRDWFRPALLSHDMVVSGVLEGRLVSAPIIVFATAMRDTRKRVTGVLFLSLDLAWLRRQLTKDLPDDTRLVVIDGKGTVAVHYPDDGRVDKSAAQLPVFQKILAKSGEGTLEDVEFEGDRKLFAYTKMLDTVSGPVYLWLSVPATIVEGPAQRLALFRVGVLLTVFIVMMGLLVWGGNRMVLRPLLSISRVAHRFKAGDLSARTGLPHGDDEIGLVAKVLDETAAAIEGRECRLVRYNQALRILSAVNRTLLRSKTEQELLEEMCRVIVEAGNYRMAWVGYAEDGPTRSVRIVAAWGAERDFLDRLGITWDETERGRGPTGTAIRKGSPVASTHIETDPNYAPWQDLARSHNYASALALPLRLDDTVFGALCICAVEPDAFSSDVIEILNESVNDLVFGIAKIRAEVEHTRTRAERDRIAYAHAHHAEILQKSLEQSIQAIADTVDARDPYTAGHQRRVAELAVCIARELGLPEDKVQGIHLAAIIHDLGKISVPAEILSKPGKLTDVEFMLVKRHSQAGYDILKDVDFPWPIADIVLQHHEKLDGSGYPQGLKGSQILLESRIMSVADVVEAMSSHRPYRAALGIEVALKEVERGRGTAYDPAVVDACLKLFRENRFAFQT